MVTIVMYLILIINFSIVQLKDIKRKFGFQSSICVLFVNCNDFRF